MADADAIAAVFSSSFRLLTFLPILHTVEEDRGFIANVILRQCEVAVAESAGRIVSFLARDGEEIRLLHTHPEFVGTGAGSLLLDGAKASAAALELWCFQANTGARRFYERHGFRALRRCPTCSTAGSARAAARPGVHGVHKSPLGVWTGWMPMASAF